MSKDYLLQHVRTIEGWLSDHEALLLYNLALKAPEGAIVEIGSWKGKSTVCLGIGRKESGRIGKVYAVDPHKGELTNDGKKYSSTYISFLRTLTRNKLTETVVPIIKTSRSAARSWRKPISVLFIDGIHDYNHAREDFLLWMDTVRDGGFVAFHDSFCGIDGVMEAVREVFLPWEKLTSLGTVGSILYGRKGDPNVIQRLVVAWKRKGIQFAHKIYKSQIVPAKVKKFIIHKILRIMFVTNETLAVYF